MLIWLMVAVLFAVFALPALLLLGKGGKAEMSVGRAAIHGWTHVRQLIGEVRAIKPMYPRKPGSFWSSVH